MLPVGSSRLSSPPVVARLREEEVHAIELSHVADPVRLQDRLAAGHRQRVERADRPLGVLAQVVEIRRRVPVADPLEDAEVDLQHFLDAIEDTPDRGSCVRPREFADVAVRCQVDIQLRSVAAQQACEQRAEVCLGRKPAGWKMRLQDLAQVRKFVP